MELTELVRQLAEQKATEEQVRIAEESELGLEQTGIPTEHAEPAQKDDYIRELQSRSLPLKFDSLNWNKKVRCDGDQRGNLGWFVDDGDKRYFIHRGRTTTVRPARPSNMLAEWRKKTQKNPYEIELDYQTGENRGNHAWYVRTYSGRTWRIAMGGQSKTTPTITELP